MPILRQPARRADQWSARRRRSGLPLNGAVTDIRAVEAANPVDCPGQGIGSLLGGLHAVTQRSGTQRPATLGHHLAIAQGGAGVEDLAVRADRLIQSLNDITLAVVARVASGSQDHAKARA